MWRWLDEVVEIFIVHSPSFGSNERKGRKAKKRWKIRWETWEKSK